MFARPGVAAGRPTVARCAPAADEAAAWRAAFTSARTNFADVLYRTMKGKPDSERGAAFTPHQREGCKRAGHLMCFVLLDIEAG